MKKAADLALGARPFALEASNIFSRVTNEISMSPYVLSSDASKKDDRGDKLLVVLITSNRGLCGAYNVNVFRQTLEHIK
jgi:F-type H+-transporting ATPase subunit gamma